MNPTLKHRYAFFCILLTGLLSLSYTARAEEDSKEESKQDKKANREELKSKFSFSFNDVSAFLVIIEHDTATGSGFIAKMDDKYYIFTNQHVILGGDNIRFKTISGKMLAPKRVELSATRDIARLLIDTEDGLEISANIEMDAPVGVFGNSDGAGVATALYGTINGVGGELVEVNADFVSGNSGSPAINTDKEVIGIASFVRFATYNSASEGTRFENSTRRFCYRLTDLQWGVVNWKEYNNKFGTLYRNSETLTYSIVDIVNYWANNPVDKITISKCPELSLESWIKSHNQIIKKLEEKRYTRAQFYIEYSKSTKSLSSICRARSRQISLFTKQEGLSGFLRDEFLQQENTLSYLAKVIDEFAEQLYNERR